MTCSHDVASNNEDVRQMDGGHRGINNYFVCMQVQPDVVR